MTSSISHDQSRQIRRFHVKAAILSDYMLNQLGDRALTGADMKGWRRPHGNCALHIHYFPRSPGYLKKAEKMKIFHLCKQFFTPLSLMDVRLFWSIMVFSSHNISLQIIFCLRKKYTEAQSQQLKCYVSINYNFSYYFGLASKCRLLTFSVVSTLMDS